MRLHHRARAVRLRLAIIFTFALVGAFVFLNARAYVANIRYALVPGRDDERGDDAVWLLPQAADAVPARAPEAVRTPTPLPDAAQLVIPKIGVNARIQFGIPPVADMMYQKLETGLVHYSESPRPGRPGLAVILGHSSYYSWYKGEYGTVFALLGKLKQDDQVLVQYADGQSFAFTVRQSFVVDPVAKLEDPRFQEIARTQVPGIVLLGSWPVGTAYTKLAVYAEAPCC